VFHPDRLVLEGPRLVPMGIRTEIEQRIARQRQTTPVAAGKADAPPYLLMLVRPDGIASYYRTQAALVGRKIDFGYQFVEQGWILASPAADAPPPPQPWMTAGNPAVSPRPAAAEPPAAPRTTPAAGVGRGGFMNLGPGGATGAGGTPAAPPA